MKYHILLIGSSIILFLRKLNNLDKNMLDELIGNLDKKNISTR